MSRGSVYIGMLYLVFCTCYYHFFRTISLLVDNIFTSAMHLSTHTRRKLAVHEVNQSTVIGCNR